MAPLPNPELVEAIYRLLRHHRHQYGVQRLLLGEILETVRANGLWAGKAASFWALVDDINLNRDAARQYMQIARRFRGEIRVSDALWDRLAWCHVSALCKAAKVLTPENAETVMSALLCLHGRDVGAVIAGCASAGTPAPALEQSAAVQRLTRAYFDLPDDDRLDFLSRINPQGR